MRFARRNVDFLGISNDFRKKGDPNPRQLARFARRSVDFLRGFFDFRKTWYQGFSRYGLFISSRWCKLFEQLHPTRVVIHRPQPTQYKTNATPPGRGAVPVVARAAMCHKDFTHFLCPSFDLSARCARKISRFAMFTTVLLISLVPISVFCEISGNPEMDSCCLLSVGYGGVGSRAPSNPPPP